MRHVFAGKVYRFVPSPIDQMFTQHYQAVSDQLVRVVKLPGAPPPNTMGSAHIEDAKSGEFLGIVATDSLVSR